MNITGHNMGLWQNTGRGKYNQQQIIFQFQFGLDKQHSAFYS